MKDNYNIVNPFLVDISVPEWVLSEIFGEPSESLTPEDREALEAFRNLWVIMDYDADTPYFCTPALFYGDLEPLAGTCICCKCLPAFLGNAKLYQGSLVQRMGRMRAVFVFENGKISESVYSFSRFRSTLLTNLHLLNLKVLQQDDLAGYMVFRGRDLVFATDKNFESLIPDATKAFAFGFPRTF